MFEVPTSMDLFNATSSPASAAGPTPSDSPDGLTTDLFGRAPAPASPSRQRAQERASATSGISGLPGSGSSTLVGPPSFSGNKSPQKPPSDGLVVRVRTCRRCSTEKPYSEFYVNSKGNRSGKCKACVCALERVRKRGEPHKVALRHHEWRTKRRGYALVNVAKYRARARQLPFDLDPADIQRRIDLGVCELTGIAFDLTSPRSWNAPSLDQIKAGQGYTTDNVRVVLFSLNVMANVWGADKIMVIASAITNQRRARSSALQTSLTERLKRTLQIDDHSLFSMTWKTRTTPSRRCVSQVQCRARSTFGSGYGSWQSPMAGTNRKSERAMSREGNSRQGGGQRSGPGLEQQAEMAGWPTPMSGTPSTESYNAAGSTDYEWKIDTLIGLRETPNGPKLAGWPTATQQDAIGSGSRDYPATATHHVGTTLTDAANLAGWPTPNTPSGGRSVSTADATGRTPDGKKHTASLEHAVKFATWPTPTTHDAERGGMADRAMGETRHGSNLQDFALLASWATPTSRDFKSDSATDAYHERQWAHVRGKPLSAEATLVSGPMSSGSPAATAKRGQLNPRFSLWLQGYPTAWASCGERVMRSSRRSQPKSSVRI